jgi:hypothetical protein
MATDYGLDGRGSIPGSDKIFLISIVSRLYLVSTLPPIQWVLGADFSRVEVTRT